MKETILETKNGQGIRVLEAGDPKGIPVIYMHGTPASGQLYSKWIDDAKRQGVRLIGYDRPGYGGSTPLDGRSVADASTDALAIADHLDIGRFSVWGISGGGPHALACAALIPGRCAGVAVLASPASPDYSGPRRTRINKHVSSELLHTAEDRRNWRIAHRENDERSARANLSLLEVLAADHHSVKRGVYRALMPFFIGKYEAKALSRECAQWYVSFSNEALQQGIVGAQDDEIAIFHQPWGFELSSIKVPVLLLHGKEDQFVNVREGEWLATQIPDVEARFPSGDGHISLSEFRIPEVHKWLIGLQNRIPVPGEPTSTVA